MGENENNYLYHYTNYIALKGILENKELWLSNVRSMNDTSEMLHFMKCLRLAVKRECIGKEAEVDSLFDNQIERLKKEQAYSLSLSELYDDAAQWERYANDGKGVLIKFNVGKLKELLDNRKLVLQKIFYRDDVSNHQVKADIVLYILEGHTFDFNSIDGAFENAWASSVAFKHSSFKNEKEKRIMLMSFFAKYYEEEPKYNMEDWGIREYYPLKIVDDNNNLIPGLIEEIMIGPRAYYPEGVFERYLEKIGLDSIKICYSKCPLR